MDIEKDINNINEIDMECSSYDEDDMSGFGNFINKQESNDDIKNDGYQRCTGVVIDLSDDDFNTVSYEEPIEIKDLSPIKAELNDFGGIDIINNNTECKDYSGINEIDMECNCCEDDIDLDDDSLTHFNSNLILDFGDDEDYCEHHENGENFKPEKSYDDYMDELTFSYNKSLDEDIVEEKKSNVEGEVKKDYWKNLQKQHASTNKKGAYNTHFHLSGNPKAEMDMFNHDMTPSGSLTSTSINASSTNVSSSASAESGGEACCENLINSKKLFEEFLGVIGFILLPDKNGYCLKDKCNIISDTHCKNKEEVFDQLYPYINDTLIYPLQSRTNQNYNDCKDWCNWYKDSNCKDYPDIARDIKYCDLFANHKNELF